MIINPQESKKRSIEEDFQPVLVRVSSTSSSYIDNYIHINKNQFKIGRKPDNDKVLLHVLISRNHCILQQDKNNGNWLVTNLSSTDTLLNEKSIERNKSEVIKEGDILQLSLSDSFRYRFTLNKTNLESTKCRRLESNDFELNTVLHKRRLFVESQENQRKNLETQLCAKQEEQEQLKQELQRLLQDQKITKTHNEELNSEIIQLQKKIELGNSIELELQEKYRNLLSKLENERVKYEQKLEEEKQKWQKALQETKQEKEKLEMSMVEQMEEWRKELERAKQEEWQQKIENLLQEEKNVQIKLQNEKQLLEEKLIEMGKTLEEREQAKQRNDIKDCVAEDVKNINTVQKIAIEVIDLTAGVDDTQLNLDNCKNDVVLNKVNDIMDEQLTCSICSELFITATTLNCTHTFCRYCIDSWIKRRKECPNCRTMIISMTRSLVVDNFIDKMLETLTPEQMQKRNQLIEQRTKLSRVNVKRKVTRTR
ncbi:PREDICTED: E3 ubiquitin-protein ligase RNF8-B-like [Ceratosolen solmsi marchali]|uniref:E3 ubiquitin-protein ligase CHFR n=1 Tax=Ceratosolen solmsi marchali TaxID=326594 RepID=A0AAJ6VN80_9HYME|nr:PREDICTED: E3 ubiquitin-protein ligase RNF8-B-like [Ceratosolen solmsi marchali]